MLCCKDFGMIALGENGGQMIIVGKNVVKNKKRAQKPFSSWHIGGESEIRTRDRDNPVPPFQGGDLNHSSISPSGAGL